VTGVLDILPTLFLIQSGPFAHLLGLGFGFEFSGVMSIFSKFH